MENVDIKTVIYVIIAIIWFIYSSFKKSQKDTERKTAQPPPLSEEEIKEIFNSGKQKLEPVLRKKTESFSKIENSEAKKKVAKTPTTISTSFSETGNQPSGENGLQGILAGVDPKDMVIYSEILKRPEF